MSTHLVRVVVNRHIVDPLWLGALDGDTPIRQTTSTQHVGFLSVTQPSPRLNPLSMIRFPRVPLDVCQTKRNGPNIGILFLGAVVVDVDSSSAVAILLLLLLLLLLLEMRTSACEEK